MKIQAKHIWPGSHDIDSGRHYYPEFTWDYYQESYEQLKQNPSIKDEELAVYDIWNKQLLHIFGEIPSRNTSVDKGKFWRPGRMCHNLRTLAQSFDERGYSEKDRNLLEKLTARISSEGKVCIIQGNKRCAWLQKHQPDKVLNVQIEPSLGDWDKFKLHGLYPSGKQQTYHPIEHPDFKEWNQNPTQPCTERWEMIKPCIKPGWSVVDLGCNTGWFCRRLKELGCQVKGYDNSLNEIRMANTIEGWSPACNGNRIDYSVEDVTESTLPDADAVICTSVLMHLFPQEPGKGLEFINKLSCQFKCLFIDTATGTYTSSLPFTPSNITQVILDNTEYTSYIYLGPCLRENRQLYMFRC